jgi:hypothetical protein
MLVWGWRVPFLMSIVTLAVAAILRYNMPESSEFTMSREELSEEAIKRARQANAHSIEAGNSAAGSTDGHISVIDVEGQSAAAVGDDKKAHYVPVLELFRGYWSGLVLHSLYGACESSKQGHFQFTELYIFFNTSWLPANQHVSLDQVLLFCTMPQFE